MKHFEICYGLAIVKVVQLDLPGRHIYKLHFPNEVPDITIECVTAAQGATFWDTVPSGNTELAEAVGMLITNYSKAEQE